MSPGICKSALLTLGLCCLLNGLVHHYTRLGEAQGKFLGLSHLCVFNAWYLTESSFAEPEASICCGEPRLPGATRSGADLLPLFLSCVASGVNAWYQSEERLS